MTLPPSSERTDTLIPHPTHVRSDFPYKVPAIFIRAPWVGQVGPGVEVLAQIDDGPATGRILAVREGHVMATSFHPEVGGDDRIHRQFVDLVRDRKRTRLNSSH